MSSPATLRSGHTTAQVVDLTFLTEEEEMTLRAVLEEDVKLQQAEETRLRYGL